MSLLKRKVIAIDMDLTIVDSLTPWLYWIHQTQGVHFPVDHFAGINPGQVPDFITEYDKMPAYFRRHNPNLSTYNEELFLQYWKQPNLYQNLRPVTDSVHIIEGLARKADIVFVTSCFPGHIDSKKMFLKAHFGHMPFDFIDTRAKHLVDYDVLIDDNPGVIMEGLARRPRSVHICYMATFIKATMHRRDNIFLAPHFRDIKKAVEPHFQGAYLAMDKWSEIPQILKGIDL